MERNKLSVLFFWHLNRIKSFAKPRKNEPSAAETTYTHRFGRFPMFLSILFSLFLSLFIFFRLYIEQPRPIARFRPGLMQTFPIWNFQTAGIHVPVIFISRILLVMTARMDFR